MTRQKLSQYYYLQKELRMWEKELHNLEEQSLAKAQEITGMPFQNTGETSDKVAELATDIIDVKERISTFMVNIQLLRTEIEKYVMSLDDSFERQIIMYRCINLLPWKTVASLIGGGNTADGCRMFFDRKYPRN